MAAVLRSSSHASGPQHPCACSPWHTQPRSKRQHATTGCCRPCALPYPAPYAPCYATCPCALPQRPALLGPAAHTTLCHGPLHELLLTHRRMWRRTSCATCWQGRRGRCCRAVGPKHRARVRPCPSSRWGAACVAWCATCACVHVCVCTCVQCVGIQACVHLSHSFCDYPRPLPMPGPRLCSTSACQGSPTMVPAHFARTASGPAQSPPCTTGGCDHCAGLLHACPACGHD